VTVLLRPAGISAELQEQLVHGGGCAEGDGQVPQQHATDFGRHQAAQQATGDAVRLPVAREDLHALRRIVSPLFSEFSLFVVPTDISILFPLLFPVRKHKILGFSSTQIMHCIPGMYLTCGSFAVL